MMVSARYLASLALPCALAMTPAACAIGVPLESGSSGDPATDSMSGTDTTGETSTTSTTGSTESEGTTTGTGTDTATDTDTDTDSDTGTDSDGEVPVDFDAPKQRIYQLTVRTFSNTKTLNNNDGDIAANGVGKFIDIDTVALAELRSMGYSHIWLHGVLQQATSTPYDSLQEPGDDPDTIKGKAGNYDAISDYYDVSADYAMEPIDRLGEFQDLVERIHAADMKVLIDLIPNQVARSYHTNIPGKQNFGSGDNTDVFFDPNNSFFYLQKPIVPEVYLPTPDWWTPPGMPDNGYPGEGVPRVSGNNAVTAMLDVSDWYDTVKLNYGIDFSDPMAVGNYDPIPKTWNDMDAIVAYWQDMGVDGFRIARAHLVPLEFLTWMIDNARSRDPNAYFLAAGYESAPNKLTGFTRQGLLDTGVDAINDRSLYEAVKNVVCCKAKVTDITPLLDESQGFSDKLLRYSEDHRERRIASAIDTQENPPRTSESGFGTAIAGVPGSALLYLLGRGPLAVHNGQEVGEPGSQEEGYGIQDGRTTIYDYWTMPDFVKWVSDHKYDGSQLSDSQRDLLTTYRRLLAIATQPAIASGEFVSLHEYNLGANTYCSAGRWCYTFIRHSGEQIYLIAVNLSPENLYTLDLKVPISVLTEVGLDSASEISLDDLMQPDSVPIITTPDTLSGSGVKVKIIKSQVRVFDMSPLP